MSITADESRILVVTGTAATVGPESAALARRWIFKAIRRKKPTKVMVSLASGMGAIPGWVLAALPNTSLLYGYKPDGWAVRYSKQDALWARTGRWTDAETDNSPVIRERIDTTMVEHARHRDSLPLVLMLRAAREPRMDRAAMVALVQYITGFNRYTHTINTVTHTLG